MKPSDRESTRLNSRHSQISYAAFFFNDTATTEIYTLSLHDALPISQPQGSRPKSAAGATSLWRLRLPTNEAGRRAFSLEKASSLTVTEPASPAWLAGSVTVSDEAFRSGEHPSELPSQSNIVCRLFF